MSQICTLFKNEFDKAAKELNVAPVIVNTIYELVLKDLMQIIMNMLLHGYINN